MAFNFKNLEDYYKSGKNRIEPNIGDSSKTIEASIEPNLIQEQTEFTTKDIINNQKPHDYTTATIANNQTPHDYTTTDIVNNQTPHEYTTATTANNQTPHDYTTADIVNDQTPHDYTTAVTANNQTVPTFTTEILRPKPRGATHEIAAQEVSTVTSAEFSHDRKPIFDFNGSSGQLQHMNNFDSGFLTFDPSPDKRDGNTNFTFPQKMPPGGTTYQTFTRLKYNAHFAKADNESGIAGVTLARKNKLSNSELVDTFHKTVNGQPFVDLRSEAERNNPESPLWLRQPFIQRGMQRGEDNPKGILERINMLTAPVIDTIRVAKFLGSPKGLLFMLKNVGLQLTNPKGEFASPLHSSRIFNPLALALQVPATMLGIHIDRHFLGPFNTDNSNYEKRVFQKNKLLDGEQNRLVKLSKLDLQPGMEIGMLSGLMGPKSFFGIGKTTMFKHTSGAPIGMGAALINTLTSAIPFAGGLAAGAFSAALTGGGEDESETLDLEALLEQDKGTLFDGETKLISSGKEGTADGNIDPSEVNPGYYLTSTYEEIEAAGADQTTGNEARYETDKLKNYRAGEDDTTSKFGTGEGIEPSAYSKPAEDFLTLKPENHNAVAPIDASGTVTGTFKTTTHQEIREAAKGDTTKYGVQTGFDQSKFGTSDAEQPTATTNTDASKSVAFQPSTGPIDKSGKVTGTFKTNTYADISAEIGDTDTGAKYNPVPVPGVDATYTGTYLNSKFGEDDTQFDGKANVKKNTSATLQSVIPLPNEGEIAPGKGVNQTFNVFSYTDVSAFRAPHAGFRDFRTKDANDAYANNLVSRKVLDYGNVGSGKGLNSYDNVSDDNPGIVKVKIGDVWFRAYIKDISDKLTTGYTDVSYTGIATKAKQYDNISREWSLELAMPAFTALDLQYNYKKLNAMMQLAAPETSGNHAGGQLTEVTVGDLWDEMPTILTGIDYTINNDAGWDIGITAAEEETPYKTSSEKVLPMYFDLKLTGAFLGDVDGSVWNSTSNFFKESIWSDI